MDAVCLTKKVYIAFATDFIHPGHIKIIQEAQKLGEVTIGVLTDKAIIEYRRLPILKYEQRKMIIENIKGVKKVIPQESADYTNNLRILKPDYVVHGDDWKNDSRANMRATVIEVLKEWGGQLIEPPASEGFSSTELLRDYLDLGVTPDIRRRRLKNLLVLKPFVRVLEAHNGLSARIVEKVRVHKGQEIREFDAMWVSSLTDSTAKGKPDTQSVDFTSRMQTIDQIFEVTTKPLVLDGDNGGLVEQFIFMVKTMERVGVSAVIIEDKIGSKRNSLLKGGVQQLQDTIEEFSYKIAEGKRAQVTKEFMIIARIESFIAQAGLEDALKRAQAYIDAGADGIMIHSNKKDPSEILDFCQAYRKFSKRVPLVAVPSTYAQIMETQLNKAGVNMIIYANHLLRSAFPAMLKTAESILEHGRALEAQELCMPIQDIVTLIPTHE